MTQPNKPAKTGNVPPTTGPSHQRQATAARNSSSILVGSHYKLGRRLGKGSFGEVRYGKNTKNNEDVAIKTEPVNTKIPQLYLEFQVYKLIGATNKAHSMNGIPKVFYYGVAEKKYNALVMELLGPTLEDLFNICDRKFTLKTIMMIGIHTLRIIETVHDKGVVFRDIKPENFVVGLKSLGKINSIYIIDFGLAKSYIDQITKKHVPYREKVNLTGTARYMSINTHLGKEQSRRDDLESLGHMYMYLALGTLPWQGLKVKSSKERFLKICEMKRRTPINTLCDGYPEMAEYLNYVRRLEFNETPNYVYLRNLFTTALQKNGLEDDQNFDWKDKVVNK